MIMNHVRRKLVLASLSCLLLTLTGCGAGSDSATAKVGWSIDTISTPFNAEEDRRVKSTWSKSPDFTLHAVEAQAQSLKQVSDVEDLVAKGIDLLMVKPRDEKTLVETFRRVMQQGVPVILVDRYVQGEAYTTFIGSDNRQLGELAAQALAKLLDGKGNILVIEGTPGASSFIERTEGFMSEMRKHPNIKILASQPATARRDEGKKLMENWLQAYGSSINAVHSNTDELTMGVIQALAEATRKDVLVSSINGQMETIKAVQEGRVAFTVAYSTGVDVGIELGKLILGGEKNVPKQILIPGFVVAQQDAQKYYDPNVYMVDFLPGGLPTLKGLEQVYPILSKVKLGS